MNCFECAKANDTVAAVAVCQHCSVGLCLDHLIQATHYNVGGTHEGCGHTVPRTKSLVRVPEGIAGGVRHETAELA